MKPITVSWSEIQTARQCPFKHELSYKERWTKPVPETSALAKGTSWHELLEAHYGVIMAAQQAQKTIEPDIDPDDIMAAVEPHLQDRDGNVSEQQDLMAWMYQGYLEHYGLNEGWRIRAIEHRAEVWLPTPSGNRSMFKLKMKIDLVVEKPGVGLMLVDHKSGKNLPTDRELDLDDQFGLYTWGMRQLGKPVVASVHSAARTQRNKDQVKNPQPLDERFRRKILYRTDAELDVLAVEAYKTAKRTWALPLGEAERNPDTDTCKWKCDFTEPCLASRKGVPIVQMLEAAGFQVNKERH